MNDEVKYVSSSRPRLSFQSARTISSYLVLATLQKIVGSFRCRRSRGQLCPNFNETDTICITVTGKTYKTNYKFDCSNKWLIYLLNSFNNMLVKYW